MKIIGVLRGINVGGHHKVSMTELQNIIAEIGGINVKTILNSGNIVFQTAQTDSVALELKIENHLLNFYNFKIPVIIKTETEINHLLLQKPFEKINIHKNIRLYVTFLKDEPAFELPIPYGSSDAAFQIIYINNRIVCSVLDLSITKTTKEMEELERLFGKNCTTRNWNTVVKIANSF